MQLRTAPPSYLPTGPTNHGNDTVLNYEPTVNPIASGGYIWVIFTSRRLYGNVATTDPWQSDPRNYDVTKVANTTTKKLWVAAIDFERKARHRLQPLPAFYLPAQELLAGNMRGFLGARSLQGRRAVVHRAATSAATGTASRAAATRGWSAPTCRPMHSARSSRKSAPRAATAAT